MHVLDDRLRRLSAAQLRGLRRGIEKESLRALAGGGLARTPHPEVLGAPLTHPRITTDFSESQLELITAAHASPEAALAELTEIHQFVYRTLRERGDGDSDELLWVGSMPCGLPPDENIPIGSYGSSNIARAKSVYRMGLGHRYGRRMQTISGIHYNWSMPGLGNDEYFALIRNFRRHAFLLLLLFGASPAVCGSFVEGRDHPLVALGGAQGIGTLGLPHATSLRMGRLGYQSEAQSQIAASFNCLERYAASLQDALTRPYPPYEALGLKNLGGEYNQLATTLLQIENEFYGTIRPKRVIRPGERPLHALRERGVEYIEVRLMDLDPFEPVGIGTATMRFLDVFLLHCLLQDSPPDTPDEIAAMGRNQHRTAAFGRERGVRLERQGREASLLEWAEEILDGCAPVAAALDGAVGCCAHSDAVAAARAALTAPDTLPSARVLQALQAEHGGSYTRFMRERSVAAREALLALPFSDEQRAIYRRQADESHARRRALEAADTVDFETFRLAYLAPERLAPARLVAG